MTASERDVEQRKVAAVVAAVQAYLEEEARGIHNWDEAAGAADALNYGVGAAGMSAWRRSMMTSSSGGGSEFSTRARSWTGRR